MGPQLEGEKEVGKQISTRKIQIIMKYQSSVSTPQPSWKRTPEEKKTWEEVKKGNVTQDSHKMNLIVQTQVFATDCAKLKHTRF